MSNKEAYKILVESALGGFPYTNPDKDPDKIRRDWHKQVRAAVLHLSLTYDWS